MRLPTSLTVVVLTVVAAACDRDLPSSPTADAATATFSRGEEPGRCEDVRGAASLIVTAPGRAEGTSFGGLSGTVTIVTDLLPPDKHGVLRGTATHTIVTNRGTITTSDRVVLRPTTPPHYSGKAHVEIVGGTGDYVDAGGRLEVRGEATLAPGGAVEVTYHGVVCA